MSYDAYIALRNEVQLRAVSIGHHTLTLPEAAELEDAQRGYRYDNVDCDLTGNDPGDWLRDWFVIAEEDFLGDPIFTNASEVGFPVYIAMHGVGAWVAERIADSFAGFIAALQAVALISEGRGTPNALEENPLTEKERAWLFETITSHNPNSDLSFWEDLVIPPEE